MQCELLRATGEPDALAAELRSLIPAAELVRDSVAEIIAQVRSRGDEAVSDYTRRFDTVGAEPGALRVGDAELQAAARELDPSVRVGLERAIENVERVAQARLLDDSSVRFEHHEVMLRSAPILNAGVYVPGGRAPYPSTVVMGVVTARVAGVERIAVCAPPGRDGELDPLVLGACELTGASTVYRMGGAQAIAALAYGTESVEPVEVIVGPGNLYVQEAKRQVFGDVGIDGFAGPSDLVLIAGGDAEAEPLSLDLLAQAEHGPGTLVIAMSESGELIAELERSLAEAPDTGAVARLVQVRGLREAFELAQALAPEHLQLVGPGAEQLAPEITRAGCVFVGAASGTAFGDYIAGSNHILPTNGAARFASALSPIAFRRTFTEVRIEDGSTLARAAVPLARAEGFELHARSMEARIRDNANDDAQR
jgi:histidinol dehydrogenase